VPIAFGGQYRRTSAAAGFCIRDVERVGMLPRSTIDVLV
jgi:hypothetical protein